MKTYHAAVFLISGLSTLLLSPPITAQIASKSNSAYPNYDVRDPHSSGAPATRLKVPVRLKPPGPTQRVTSVLRVMNEAAAALAARIPGLRLEKNSRGTAPEIVGTEGTPFLTPESSAPIAETARNFVLEQAALFGLTSDQAAGLVQFADYYNPAGNMGWVEFRQEANGIPIFQAEIRTAFTARGALARTTGNLVPALDYANLPTRPALTPAEAAARAAASIGWTVKAAKLAEGAKAEGDRVVILGAGPFARPVRTELVYFSAAAGSVTLAYSMTLWEAVDAYYILVDANDGTLLWRKNITDHQTQSASYTVYTDDSPAPLSPTTALPGSGFQAPGISRTSVTLIGNEAPNTFNNNGWITDGNNTTSGNNVDCGLDVLGPDGIDAGGRATGSPNRVFNFSYDPSPNGTDPTSSAASRNGAVTNLFYWTNVYHDRLYLLGFTEAARNFQLSNFGRNPGGGTANAIAGNDAVSAQVQDYSGTNNANFSTPADGSAGRMQMYIFPAQDRDGSLDADVFLHELTHGTSNRLHNNGSGLTTVQAGGMGEGWSDFYARALLASASEDANGIYSSGAYVTYQLSGLTDNYYYGIRHFPYAVKTNVGANGKPHNPLTLADLDGSQYDITDGAYPRSPRTAYGSTNEVHFIGEFWCMALLEFRARLINRLGYTTGDNRALQIVTDAMKLDSGNPSIIQARDSIIAAATAGVGGATDALDARIAFATRGAGAGASLSTTSFAAVESFLPDLTRGAVTFTDTLGNNNGAADPGEDLVLSVPLTNPLTSANPSVSATIANYTASYGTIAASGTVIRTFAYRVPPTAAAGDRLFIPVKVTSAAGTFTQNFVLRVGSPSSTLLENFDAVAPPALPAGWTTTTAAAPGGVAGTPWVTTVANTVDAANNVFAPDSAGNNVAGGETDLISPPISLPATGSQLSFKNRYAFEFSSGGAWDGGVLEIKIGAGSFTDIVAAGGSFAQSGYSLSVAGQGAINPLSNRPAFASSSGVVTTVINLPTSAAGQNVQFRWRIGFDNITGATGWNIDTISLIGFNTATIDTDGDGIPDGYETANGLNPGDAGDAADDDDSDGFSNLEEYRAGTNPQSANSVLRLTSISRDPATGLSHLAFPTVNGRVYQIEYNLDLFNPDGWNALPGTVVGTGAVAEVVDANAAAYDHAYYRLVVLF